MQHKDDLEEKRVSEVAVYGFVAWITTYVLFVIYLLWAFLPDDLLYSLGITYYPNRYWAIAIPAYIVVLLLFVILFYVAINFIITRPLDSKATFIDAKARYPTQQDREQFWAHKVHCLQQARLRSKRAPHRSGALRGDANPSSTLPRPKQALRGPATTCIEPGDESKVIPPMWDLRLADVNQIMFYGRAPLRLGPSGP
eukprot:gnl/Trimastix_PCT/3492.p1 GENE.gnl/Trimastix_PCT/3492~~gnl/Trimastix_PCT/3492.p1  ORF type:complete len:198 (-),score=18.93 gnl/Trimastix_PCT/3492:137-730(-)